MRTADEVIRDIAHECLELTSYKEIATNREKNELTQALLAALRNLMRAQKVAIFFQKDKCPACKRIINDN